MVVEEPSIVAAASAAFGLAARAGGVKARNAESLLIGQSSATTGAMASRFAIWPIGTPRARR